MQCYCGAGEDHLPFLCYRKLLRNVPITQKIPPGRIALRRRGIMSLKRPAAGGESCKQDSFLYREFSDKREVRLFLFWESVVQAEKMLRRINL